MSNDPDPLPEVWVRPVMPERYPDFEKRRARPVTRGDLDNQYHTVALRGFGYDRAPSEPPHRYRLINIEETLDLWTKDYDFGRVIWPMWPFLFAENWKEAIDALAARKLYLFDIWAYCPSGPFERFEWSEYRVSDAMHRYLLEKLGPRFLGYDNGEQDGRYIGAYARMVCPAPATRREGYEAFCQYFRELGNDLQNYLVSLNSLTFPHYFAKMDNHRLIGTESAQALPSVPMWYAFVRGAGKQYGLLWFGNASVWNRWGAKSLADPDAEDTDAPGFRSGPTAGTSMSLLRRLWYVLTMYGSVIMGYEAGHLGSAVEEREADGQVKKLPVLTEIGKEHLKAAAWCEKHPDRGEQHTPVAFLWDFHAGWAPPRHLYTKDPYLVWGNMPYEKGDHQIDLLFRELYPDYPDAGYYHSEQGFLTATPCGDAFDALLSDASEEILNRYEGIVLLGETRLEGDLLAKLARYAANGGQVVACANQLGAKAESLFGVRCGEEVEAYHALIPEHPWTINEPFFRMRRLEAGEDTAVLARTRQGWPLAVRRKTGGQGGTLLFAADFMLSDPLLTPEMIHNEEDRPLASPYALLEHVKAILLPYLRSFNLVSVEGPPAQFLVNVTERTDRLVVTIGNHSPQPWEGTVRPKRGRILKALDWMADQEMQAGESLRVRIPPLDVAVIELLLDGEAFAVRPERR